jgi:hypothetical protein
MSNELKNYIQREFFKNILASSVNTDIFTGDPQKRKQAYAGYIIKNLILTYGAEREYVAIKLPGKFFSKGVDTHNLTPHIEIPERFLDSSGADFLIKISNMGNGIHFNFLTTNEVTAIKRSLFINSNHGKNNEFLAELSTYRESLISNYKDLLALAERQWVAIELFLNEEGKETSDLVRDGFEPLLVKILPWASKYQLEIKFDSKLSDISGESLGKRIGIYSVANKKDINLAAVTPRLTKNSLFKDKLFNADQESTLAILVRTLVLTSIVNKIFKDTKTKTITRDELYYRSNGHLRAIPAKAGAPLPEPSKRACINLTAAFREGETAYAEIKKWCGSEYTLTIKEAEFKESYKKILYEIHRLGELDQRDVNIVLPIIWGSDGSISRLTYVLRGSK